MAMCLGFVFFWSKPEHICVHGHTCVHACARARAHTHTHSQQDMDLISVLLCDTSQRVAALGLHCAGEMEGGEETETDTEEEAKKGHR